jgi:molybdopterin/thiamine biosynthesis adenylyltransferase
MKFNMAIVGLGGVGGIIADNMFAFTRSKIFGWELSELVFVDRDAYTRSNIPRQKAAGRMLGRNKAVAWRDVYQASRYNRDDVSFDAIQEWVTNETVSPMFHSLRNCPLVVMACVDNHPARLVLSRWAVSCLTDEQAPVTVIQGGCAGNYATADLFGEWPCGDERVLVGHPIEEGHPEILEDDTGNRERLSCGDLANSPEGDQTFAENFMAASMMMNILFTLLSDGGPKVLSKLKGEVMEVTMHYHNIDKDLNPGTPEKEMENETEEERGLASGNGDAAG